jgi:(R,R)-butanediol dehydrogenase / meso-butanediol dehydrogenase / diacetyl reductase
VRAVAFADGVLSVVDKPEPEAGPGDVVVQVARCGICGSDLHFKASGMLPPGAVMGHEFAGTVVSVGDGVTEVAEGQRVAVLPAGRCDGSCPSCRRGRTALCVQQGATSLGLGFRDGAYAELVRTGASTCHVMPDGMTFEQGALVEPYAVGLHAVRRSAAAADSVVGVIGAGPIGLMTLAALHADGVTNVVVAERSESRAELAAELGATVVGDASKLTSAAGGPLDVVFDCAGVTVTPPLALEQVRAGGQVVLVGAVNPGEMLQMPGLLWLVKEVDVLPSIGYETAEFAEAVTAVASGSVDAGRLVSDVRPLEAAEQSFADLASPGGPVKVMLDPSG